MSTHTTTSLPFDAATVEFDPLLRRLNLASTRRHWRELLQRAETHGWSCREFLGVLVTEEIAHRQHTRVQRAVRQARFPFLKTIEEFDFSLQSSLRLPLLGSYLAPELVTGGLSLILKGKSGRGKTHLAIAIAYRAIQQGFTARFVTAAALIEELSSASRQGKLQAVLTAYLHPHVLVVDEVGYLSYGPDVANVLFHVVNERHLRVRSMLFTTNKSPLTAWGAVLHDADLAEAIVYRILERGRLMLLDGPSYRTQHLDLDVDGADLAHDEPARISGKHRPEFPEPTAGCRPPWADVEDVIAAHREHGVVDQDAGLQLAHHLDQTRVVVLGHVHVPEESRSRSYNFILYVYTRWPLMGSAQVWKPATYFTSTPAHRRISPSRRRSGPRRHVRHRRCAKGTSV